MKRMARIITFASGKGGTGKTTAVANLGTAMALLGKRVTILDADVTMANLGMMFGLEEQGITLHDVLAGGASVDQATYEGPAGVKVVPSSISLEGVRRAKLEHLKLAVSELVKRTNILLIDSPAGLDLDAITALTLGQELVLVVTPDIASLSDALKTKIISENLGVKPLGIIVTRTSDKRVDLPINQIESVLDLRVLSVIPEDPEVRRSIALRKPLVICEPDSPAAQAFIKLAADLLGLKQRVKSKKAGAQKFRLWPGRGEKKGSLAVEREDLFDGLRDTSPVRF
jgi:septum site-determining protein MinD